MRKTNSQFWSCKIAYNSKYQIPYRLWQHPFSRCVRSFHITCYARACRNCADFSPRARLLTIKLPEQGYADARLKSLLQKFFGRHHELVDRYGYPTETWRLNFCTCHSFPFLFCLPYSWLFISNLAGVSKNAENAYPTVHMDRCDVSIYIMKLIRLTCYSSPFLFRLPWVLMSNSADGVSEKKRTLTLPVLGPCSVFTWVRVA